MNDDLARNLDEGMVDGLQKVFSRKSFEWQPILLTS